VDSGARFASRQNLLFFIAVYANPLDHNRAPTLTARARPAQGKLRGSVDDNDGTRRNPQCERVEWTNISPNLTAHRDRLFRLTRRCEHAVQISRMRQVN